MSDETRILYWAQENEDTSTKSTTTKNFRTRISAILHTLIACAIIAGFAAGIGTGSAIFWYDGAQPINVLPVLGSLILLPTLLLIPTILLGLSGLVMRAFHINRPPFPFWTLDKGLPTILSRFLPKSRELITNATTLTSFHLALYGKVEFLYLSLTTQLFTLCFLLGACGFGVWKMITTDLAFCWSATPTFVTPELIHSITSTLALPWSFSSSASIAQPSLLLIQKTRYYRLHAPLRSVVESDPAIMGQWWAFLILAIFTWAILPRFILLLFNYIRYIKAVSYTFLHLPSIPDLLEHLKPGSVQTTTNTAQKMIETSATTEQLSSLNEAGTDQIQIPTVTLHSQIILWAMRDLNLQTIPLLLQHSTTLPAHAGGTTPMSEELAIIDAVQKNQQLDRIILLVRSWEPPLLEFLDFLRDLRKASQKITPIYVIPLRFENQDANNIIWIKVLKKLADPWIHVTFSLSISLNEENDS